MDRNYYKDIYEKYYEECTERAKDELGEDAQPDSILETATDIFEETSDAEQIAGYYIANHKKYALEVWKANTEGIDLSGKDMEVDRILNALYA